MTLLHPEIGRHLLREEGEVIVDEVHHHWASYVRSVAFVVLGLAAWVASAWLPAGIAWVGLLVALYLGVRGAWGVLDRARDRFVITNMRVFRIHGVLGQSLATMPLHRILDVTVVKPPHGRLLGFGHFVFESAAQEQGLRDIRYVGRPDERDLAIQRVLQRSGLRGPRG